MEPQTRQSLPESLLDSLLEATFHEDATVHTYASRRGRRARPEIWVRERRLGRGGFGTVYLERAAGNDHHAPEFRAVKMIQVDEPVGKAGGKYIRELVTLAKFSQYKYRNSFVRFYGWYESPKPEWLFIAMEYCEYGDLRVYLLENGRLPEEEVQEVTAQVLRGVCFMHENQIAHRDLKPANILIKSKPPAEWLVKICDLGLSKRINNETTLGDASTAHGTHGFIPPELLSKERDQGGVDPFAMDIWCLGESVFQMLTQQPTFEDFVSLWHYGIGEADYPVDVLHKVQASQPAIEILLQLMAASPIDRISAQQAEKHIWIKSEVADFEHLDRILSSINLARKIDSSSVSLQKEITTPSGEWSFRKQEDMLADSSEPNATAKMTDPSGAWSNTIRGPFIEHRNLKSRTYETSGSKGKGVTKTSQLTGELQESSSQSLVPAPDEQQDFSELQNPQLSESLRNPSFSLHSMQTNDSTAIPREGKRSPQSDAQGKHLEASAHSNENLLSEPDIVRKNQDPQNQRTRIAQAVIASAALAGPASWIESPNEKNLGKPESLKKEKAKTGLESEELPKEETPYCSEKKRDDTEPGKGLFDANKSPQDYVLKRHLGISHFPTLKRISDFPGSFLIDEHGVFHFQPWRQNYPKPHYYPEPPPSYFVDERGVSHFQQYTARTPLTDSNYSSSSSISGTETPFLPKFNRKQRKEDEKFTQAMFGKVSDPMVESDSISLRSESWDIRSIAAVWNGSASLENRRNPVMSSIGIRRRSMEERKIIKQRCRLDIYRRVSSWLENIKV